MTRFRSGAKPGAAVHLPFDHLDLGDCAFHGSGAVGTVSPDPSLHALSTLAVMNPGA
jgi:hypothetical protein